MTTKFTLDLAASVPLEVPDRPTDVRVVLPEKAMEQALKALVAGETYVVARVDNDRLQLEQLAEALLPLGAMASPTDGRRTLETMLPPIVNSDPGDETGAE